MTIPQNFIISDNLLQHLTVSNGYVGSLSAHQKVHLVRKFENLEIHHGQRLSVKSSQSFEVLVENHGTVFNCNLHISWQLQRLHVIYTHEQLIVRVITYRYATQI